MVSLDSVSSDAIASELAEQAAKLLEACLGTGEDTKLAMLASPYVRASKNILRLQGQILIPQISPNDKSRLQRLSSHGMLRLYLSLMQCKPWECIQIGVVGSVLLHLQSHTRRRH